MPLQWDIDSALFKLTSNPARTAAKYGPPSDKKDVHVHQHLVSERASIRPTEVYPVAKCGRTTGWSAGLINSTDSILRRHNVMRFDERDDTRPGEISAPVLCHAIVPLRTAEPASIQGGDSGSCILHNINRADAQATVVGLGRGEIKRQK